MSTTLDKSAPQVRAMFSDIAGRYDLLNHLLSANQDKVWRRHAIKMLEPQAGQKILDLCCGTGDFSLECLKQQPACEITAADFAFPMLQIARGKLKPEIPLFTADALHLPFADQSFDSVMVAFGVRNFSDTAAGIQEIARVLKPGGKLMMLEFLRPQSAWLKFGFGVFFRYILPPIGRLISGHQKAYSYLPASVNGFYDAAEIKVLFEECGLPVEKIKHFQAGIASAVLGRKPI